MAEIYKSETSLVKTKIYWGGEITDADGDVTASVSEVVSDNYFTLLATYTATKSETDIGTYQITIPESLTLTPKQLRVRWTYFVDGTQASNTQIIDVVTPYVNLHDVIDELGLGTDPSDPMHKTYNELVMAERYARKVIEIYTQQKFYSYDSSEVAYGSGSDILPLTRKINSLTSVIANDIVLENMPFEIAESGFAVRLNRANMLDNTVYTANGMIPPTINDYSGIFNKDARYKVTGSFGWTRVPNEVEIAAIELMKDYFSKDKVWRNKYIKSISTFDWQFDFNSATFSGTGNNYVDQLLLPYVISKMVLI